MRLWQQKIHRVGELSSSNRYRLLNEGLALADGASPSFQNLLNNEAMRMEKTRWLCYLSLSTFLLVSCQPMAEKEGGISNTTGQDSRLSDTTQTKESSKTLVAIQRRLDSIDKKLQIMMEAQESQSTHRADGVEQEQDVVHRSEDGSLTRDTMSSNELRDAIDSEQADTSLSAFGLFCCGFVGLLLVGGLGYYYISRKRFRGCAVNSKSDLDNGRAEKPVAEVPNPIEPMIQLPTESPVEDDDRPASVLNEEQTAEWHVLADSVIGRGHIKAGMPCQDSHGYKSLGKGWGICFVSDGAGSAKCSELGSSLVCSYGIELFRGLIAEQRWIEEAKLPDDREWSEHAKLLLSRIAKRLYDEAKSRGLEIQDLAATCMLAIYSPFGVLTAHVGDGRGAYHDAVTGEWRALFTPHSGEEANQTIFITSPWFKIDTLGGIVVPESHVYNGDIDALCLMSDGMERAVFDCSVYDEETERYYDPNRPTADTMEHLVKTVHRKVSEGTSNSELKEMWHDYLSEGNNTIATEPDDKTLLLAIRPKNNG